MTSIMLTSEHRGPSDVRAGKKVVATIAVESSESDDVSSSDDNSASEQSGIVEGDSDADPSLSEAEESEPEPASDKKASPRKPSKKALETAMNEVGAVDNH
jgi:hypothetical protein